jgi:hypothetical protein
MALVISALPNLEQLQPVLLQLLKFLEEDLDEL